MSATSAIPLRFREPRPGPEHLLIEWFLSETRVPIPRGHQVSVFREPSIESGMPDLVLVVWKPSLARAWNAARADLTKSDFRFLQLMVHQGPKTAAQLEDLSRSPIEPILTRLECAHMIHKRGRRWQPRPLGQIFAATQIIAVEAKMSDWRRGLEQAATNRWFASASYLLMPRAPRSGAFRTAADASGVGLWTQDTPFLKTAASGSLPCSYASWLFHEWAWRQSLA